MATAPDPVVVVNPMAAEVDRKVLATPATICLASCYLLLLPLLVPLNCYEIAVVVHVRSTGDAPILKQSKFKVRVPSPRHPLSLFPLAIQDLFCSEYSWKLGFRALVSRSRLQNWGLFCLNPNPFHTVRRVEY